MLSTTYYPPIKYASCILVEPMVMAKRFTDGPSKFLVDSAVKRRDIWASSEEALKLFRSRPAYRTWDDRVLNAFVVSQSEFCSMFVSAQLSLIRTMLCVLCQLQTILTKLKV